MSIKIISIGDIMLGENVHHFRRSIATRFYGDFRRLIPPEVRAAANSADLVIGNLECSLMPDRDRMAAPLARAAYAAPESALDCFDGISTPLVLNVANNHFGEHGQLAMDYTVSALRKRGFHCIGCRPHPLEMTVKGRSVLLWGASLVEDRHGEGYVRTSAVNILRDLELKKFPGADYKVLSLHWGEEYRMQPSAAQERLAGKLAAGGIDLILGHHPHVVQPVRFAGGTPVAYSHGNFIFDQNFSALTRIGLMTEATLGKTDVRCHLLRSRKYRIDSVKEVTLRDLEAFCRRRRFRSNPMMMRILMKLEMVANGREVPREVWGHFMNQLRRKVRA